MFDFQHFKSKDNLSSCLLKSLWIGISKKTLSGLIALMFGCGVAAEPFAYVTNSDPSAPGISVIDAASTTVVATIPLVQAYGVAISPNGEFIYAGNYQNIAVISKATNSIVAMVPVGSTPLGLAASKDGAYVYVTHPNDNYVSVVATAHHRVVATIPVGAFPAGIDVTPNGNLVYVANSANRSISVIATASNTVIATVPADFTPNSVAITPDGAFVYVTNIGSDNVTVLATATNTVISTIPVGEGPIGLVVAPNGNFVYVATARSNAISIIDTKTNKEVDRILSVGGGSPNGLDITPDGAFIYVANRLSDTVSVIEASTKKVISTVKVGGYPIAFGKFIGPEIVDCEHDHGNRHHHDKNPKFEKNLKKDKCHRNR